MIKNLIILFAICNVYIFAVGNYFCNKQKASQQRLDLLNDSIIFYKNDKSGIKQHFINLYNEETEYYNTINKVALRAL